MKLRNMTSVFLTCDEGIYCLYRIGSRVANANNRYIGSAGGHFEPEELNDPRACVLREMEEELGLTEADIEDLRLRYIALRLKDGEVRQNYYYFARLKMPRPLFSNEGVIHLIPYDQADKLDMPASAKEMMLHYLRIGRFTSKIYGGVIEKENSSFVELVDF